MTQRYYETQSWQQVPAELHSLNLESSYSDDSTTYTVTAKYSYVVDSVEYINTRVALRDGYDNVGSYWYDLHDDLRSKQAQGKAFAWVDLERPENAVLDRSFRWSLAIFGTLFIVVFGMFGLAMIWASMLPDKSNSEIISDAKDGITSHEASGHKFIFFFGLMFFVMGSGIAAAALPDALRNGEYGALLVLLFAFVGAGLMYFAWRSKRIYQKIGKTILRLDPVPGAIGGQVGGYFDVGMQIDNTPIYVFLSCYKETRRNKERHRSIKWQDKVEAYIKDKGNGQRVTFVLDVPEHLPEPSSTIDWELDCRGMVYDGRKSIELFRKWSVPMEKSTRSSRSESYIPDHFVREREVAKGVAAEKSAAAQIDVEHKNGTIHITSDWGRAIKLPLGLGVFGLIFALVGIATINGGWFFGGVFFGVGSFFTGLALYILGREINTVVDPNTRAIA